MNRLLVNMTIIAEQRLCRLTSIFGLEFEISMLSCSSFLEFLRGVGGDTKSEGRVSINLLSSGASRLWMTLVRNKLLFQKSVVVVVESAYILLYNENKTPGLLLTRPKS